MKVLLKTICFYLIALLLGNLICAMTGLFTNHEFMLGYQNWDTFWVIPVLSGILSLPLGIPCLIYFPLQSFFKPAFPKRLTMTALFGLALGFVYIFVLDIAIGWLNQPDIWLPFVAGSALAGVLIEFFFNEKPQYSETLDSILLENS